MLLAGSRSLNKLAAMHPPTFHLFLWPHRLLFLGPAFDAQPHRHHAAQLALGLHDRLRVRGGQDQPWQEAAAFYVPPDVPHDELGNRAVASAAGVSESWLSHHFGDRVGVPIRRYVLWRRLRLAIKAALDGDSLTDAAHAAGFSDSAHLTRTFRETFGVAPSFLFGDRQAIRVHFIS